jgi:hypothetical protein
MSEKKYYFAVDDQTYLKAKVVNGKVEFYEDDSVVRIPGANHDFRVISEKFVDDPGLALINILIPDHQESNILEKRDKVLSEITYVKDEDCFVWYEYLTLGTMKWPKPCQMEKFENGEYEFFVTKHEVQILTSNLVDIDLNTITKNITPSDINIQVI